MHAQTCPVCLGKGNVPNGFYLNLGQTWASSSTTPEKCKSCAGIGIVFVPDDHPILNMEGT